MAVVSEEHIENEHILLTRRKIRITDEYLDIPTGWLGKTRRIGWHQVCKVSFHEADHALHIWYMRSPTSIKTRRLGGMPLHEATTVVAFWEKHLLDQVQANGSLTGTILTIPFPHIFALYGILFAFLVWQRADTPFMVYRLAPPELRLLVLWSLYWYCVFLGVPFFVLAFLTLTEYRMHQGWKAWWIDRNGVSRQNRFERWLPLAYSGNTRLTNHEIVLDGIEPPWTRFTHHLLVPHLVALGASTRQVVPISSQETKLTAAGWRLVLLWPFIILGIWYMPLLWWEVPETLELHTFARLTVLAALGGGGVGGGAVLIHAFLNTRKWKKEFAGYVEKIHVLHCTLGWYSSL